MGVVGGGGNGVEEGERWWRRREWDGGGGRVVEKEGKGSRGGGGLWGRVEEGDSEGEVRGMGYTIEDGGREHKRVGLYMKTNYCCSSFPASLLK